MDVKKKKTRVWLWILLGVIAAVVVAIVILASSARKKLEGAAYKEYAAVRGDVSATITGSGKLRAAGSETMKLPDGAEVSEVYMEAGDAVFAGDILAELDAGSLEYRAAQLYDELAALDRTIAVKTTVDTINAPVEGRIKYLPAQKGGSVSTTVGEYGSLALISTDGLMRVEFDTEKTCELFIRVTVEWEGGFARGEIAARTPAGYAVTLQDNTAPYMEAAKVYDGDVLLGEGTLKINAPVAVYGSDGRIKTVHCAINDKVKLNEKLFTLNDEYPSSAYTQALKNRSDKAAELEAVMGYIGDRAVRAQTDGVVSAVYISEGEKTGPAGAAASGGMSAAFDISVGGAVKMNIEVDELDIDTVALGQAAGVTLDAYPNEEFAAVVTHISYIGASAGSITTYSVEITLDYDQRLLSGMNGSAVITSDSVNGVLVIPIEAIHEDSTGIYVYIKDENGERLRADITTGLSDGSLAEVTSGLAEGDVVLYEAAEQSMFPFTPPFANGMGNMDAVEHSGGE